MPDNMETEIDLNDPMMALLNDYIEKRVLESCHGVAEHLWITFDARLKPLEETILELRNELEELKNNEVAEMSDELELNEEVSSAAPSDAEDGGEDDNVYTLSEFEKSIDTEIQFDKWGNSFLSKAPTKQAPSKAPTKARPQVQSKAPTKVPSKAPAAQKVKASTLTSQDLKRPAVKSQATGGGKASATRGRPKGKGNETIPKPVLATQNAKLKKLVLKLQQQLKK